MEIKNSLEWQTVRSDYESKIQKLKYDPSVRQMLRNIDTMVVELSKIEVEARRTRVRHYANAQLAKINDSVELLERLLVMAILYSD